MRRRIILFMLCLLPVQISWAVVSDYAAHESAANGQHDVYHPEAHVVATVSDIDSPSQSTAPDQAKFSHDHCQLAGFIGLLTTTELNAPVVPDSLFLQGQSSVFSSQIFDRPERPKWLPLA